MGDSSRGALNMAGVLTTEPAATPAAAADPVAGPAAGRLLSLDACRGVTIAGMLLTDLILGRDNPWAALYDPKRVRVGAAPDLARENLNVAAQYAAWLMPGAVVSIIGFIIALVLVRLRYSA